MSVEKNTYELTYIVNAVISDDQIKDLIRRVTSYVSENGGEIIDVEEWGSRRLAFPIQKKRNGYYVNMYFRATGTVIARMERALEIDDNILRYLTLKMDAKMIRHYENRKVADPDAIGLIAEERSRGSSKDRDKMEIGKGVRKAPVSREGAEKEEKRAKTYERPVVADEKPAETDEKAADADEKPAETDEKAADADEKPASINEKPAEEEDKPTEMAEDADEAAMDSEESSLEPAADVAETPDDPEENEKNKA
ncbi:MAG: 30S ribosomal protein S6 [Bacteroidetes bacterium]|nr:30S ribosomal protein S6 [Bacteroidota bacterium]